MTPFRMLVQNVHRSGAPAKTLDIPMIATGSDMGGYSPSLLAVRAF